MSYRILLLDPGVSRGALVAARSLRRAGHKVGVAGPVRGPASWSRASEHFHLIPAPGAGIDSFIEAVGDAVASRGYDVILPGGDPELLALSAHREQLGSLLPSPPHAALISATDKVELAQRAGEVGLASPDIYEADIDSLETVGLPVVVKARLHGDPQAGAPERFETEIARTRAEVEELCKGLRAMGLQPMLQEVVAGDLMALTILFGPDGNTIARVQQRAERIWPRAAGISVRARTEPLDEELVRRAEVLLRGLNWSGLAQMQFLVSDSGETRLIDLNGRLYGSLALALAAGVDLPVLWIDSALTSDAPSIREGRVGVRYQWFEGDLRRALEDDSTLRSALGALAYAPGAAHSIWSARDPRPALRHSGDLVRRMIRKTFRR